MPRILIVDDEGAIRGLLSTAFEMAGYEVRTAADGEEAVRICTAETFDVVLSDVVMPSMNGHDLVRQIAQQYPETQTVLMSGFDVGCEDCPLSPRCVTLAKPFKPRDAVKLVDGILGQTSAPHPRPPAS
jgi:DNA-binding NtrC family response regulator